VLFLRNHPKQVSIWIIVQNYKEVQGRLNYHM
jgi:hypothetical protein